MKTDQDTTIAELKEVYRKFAIERNWDQWHNAKNMSMIAATEVAELMEIFRFSSEQEVDEMFAVEEKRLEIEDEIVDSVGALLRLAERYDIDVAQAFKHKFAKNEKKYPVEKSRSKGIDKVAWICIEDRKVLGARSEGKVPFYIPGGKREGIETDWECLSREVKEELDVELLPDTKKVFGQFKAQAHGKEQGLNVIMKCYFADYQGELKPSAEIEELRWLTYADVSSELTGPVDKLIISRLKDLDLIE